MTINRYKIELVVVALLGVFALFVFPNFVEFYTIISSTIYVSLAILALSLALIWGFGGILCFGQAAFFGLGGYAYAVGAFNFDSTIYAALLAVFVPTLFAAALGYFMFYGRLSDVYLGVITLTVTLILFKLVNSTGGDAYAIGKAKLGGFNGMPGTPLLENPITGVVLSPEAMFSLATALLFICYFACKALLATRFGRVVIAIRENETRAELLGYDVRPYKLIFFSIGAGIAGISGMLFANAVFISPTMFDMASTARILIWVIVGGLGTLIGPVIGCIALLMITTTLGKTGYVDPNVALGLILIIFVLLVPRGLLPLCSDFVDWIIARFVKKPKKTPSQTDQKGT
ncbi:MAG: branched-chain amino acid ABC transporter permease [Rhizobiaceae bacterium]|nr:branched-chain amino acid ABC transporter permease [Rhizobiaceae bacterium]